MAEEQLSRRERKKLQSKNKIIDGALEMFHTKGYQATSIADIMCIADLGVGTFYNYFNSKEEILLCILDRMAEDIKKNFLELQKAGVSYKEVLRILVSDTAKLIAENKFVLPLFFSVGNTAKGDGSHAPILMQIFLHVVEQGQSVGEFRHDVSSGLIAELIHSLFQAAAFSHLSLSFEENINKKMLLLMDGISV